MTKPETKSDRPCARPEIAVIGGGPAGLRAAEVAATGGAQVALYDAMPSVGRKFLIAGKSGLNLTNAEALEGFLSRYATPQLDSAAWRAVIEGFDNAALRAWVDGLGFVTTASPGGKVFPQPMKAAPLLRAWVRRLKGLGVTFRMRHRLARIDPEGALTFATPAGTSSVRCDAAILALGGGSWPQTGSDGTWASLLAAHGIGVSSLAPSNCGWESSWPLPLLCEAEGAPLKNVTLHHGASCAYGDLVITRYGLEGTPIYQLGPSLRCAGPRPSVTLDLKPDLLAESVAARLVHVRRNYIREASRRLNLSPAAASLLRHLPYIGPWKSSAVLAATIKACPIQLTRSRPLAEAISSAGGVEWTEIESSLMLKKLPGIFVAGEMVDWDAPTGGYLLQACFATGTHAATAALTFTHSDYNRPHRRRLEIHQISTQSNCPENP